VSQPVQASSSKPKTAAQIRAEKLAKALRACKKDRVKKKRAACEASARKKYGPAKKAKKSTHSKSSSGGRGE